MSELSVRVIELLRGLRGVVAAVELDDGDRAALLARGTPDSAWNRGVEEVLERDVVVALFKDEAFRPPPEPTLLLVDDGGEILGRELLPGDPEPAGDRRFAHLGKDFVLFADRTPRGRLRFLLPPVRFPEVERVRGVARAVSASPDTPQDEYLRERFRIVPGRQLASVLVGFDRRNA